MRADGVFRVLHRVDEAVPAVHYMYSGLVNQAVLVAHDPCRRLYSKCFDISDDQLDNKRYDHGDFVLISVSLDIGTVFL